MIANVLERMEAERKEREAKAAEPVGKELIATCLDHLTFVLEEALSFDLTFTVSVSPLCIRFAFFKDNESNTPLVGTGTMEVRTNPYDSTSIQVMGHPVFGMVNESGFVNLRGKDMVARWLAQMIQQEEIPKRTCILAKLPESYFRDQFYSRLIARDIAEAKPDPWWMKYSNWLYLNVFRRWIG